MIPGKSTSTAPSASTATIMIPGKSTSTAPSAITGMTIMTTATLTTGMTMGIITMATIMGMATIIITTTARRRSTPTAPRSNSISASCWASACSAEPSCCLGR